MLTLERPHTNAKVKLDHVSCNCNSPASLSNGCVLLYLVVLLVAQNCYPQCSVESKERSRAGRMQHSRQLLYNLWSFSYFSAFSPSFKCCRKTTFPCWYFCHCCNDVWVISIYSRFTLYFMILVNYRATSIWYLYPIVHGFW